MTTTLVFSSGTEIHYSLCAMRNSPKECASPISSKTHYKHTLYDCHYYERLGTFSSAPRKLKFPNEDSAVENINNDNTSGGTKRDSANEDVNISKLLNRFPTHNCNAINSVFKNINSSDSDDFDDSSHFLESESEEESGYSLRNILENINKSKSNQCVTRHKDFHSPGFDFILELKAKNCFGILSCILSYISDEDIRKFNNVSKAWREVVSSDKNATLRLKAYLKKKKDLATGSQKENQNSFITPERGHKSAFFALTNSPVEVTPQPLHLSPSPARFDCFIEEIRKLQKEEIMIKCPKCCYPSRAESGNRNCCSRMLCQYVFCSICLSPCQNKHTCSMSKLNDALPSIKIGSKRSKRNLRRL